MKRIYIAAYHQSKFGKLFDMSIPQIVANAITETCAKIGAAFRRGRGLHRGAEAYCMETL